MKCPLDRVTVSPSAATIIASEHGAMKENYPPNLFFHLSPGAVQQCQYALVDLHFLQQLLFRVVMHLIDANSPSPVHAHELDNSKCNHFVHGGNLNAADEK